MKLLPLRQSFNFTFLSVALLSLSFLSCHTKLSPPQWLYALENRERRSNKVIYPWFTFTLPFAWIKMPSQSRLESFFGFFFTLLGLLIRPGGMTPDFSRAWAGRPGKQHRAEGAGGPGVCGEGQGGLPQMQKVQKDQQAGERQDAHILRLTCYLSLSSPPTLSAPLHHHRHARLPLLYSTSPRGRW